VNTAEATAATAAATRAGREYGSPGVAFLAA